LAPIDLSMRQKDGSVILVAGLFSLTTTVWAAAPSSGQDDIRERLRERFLQRQLQGQQDPQQQPQQPAQNGQQLQIPPAPQQQQLASPSRVHQAAIEKSIIGGIEVAIWRPTAARSQAGQTPVKLSNGAASAQTARPTPAPLVIFSHGYRGTPTQSVALMNAMADAGYLVIAPKHRDAIDAGHLGERLSVGFGRPQEWNKDSCAYRFEDVRTLLDALHKDPQWNSRIDWSRLALAGHSLGGYTVLGLAGAWPQWKTSGVKAVLALSPYTMPFQENGDLQHLGVPVMYQGGTADFSITPFVKRRGGAFDQTAAPVYFVDFEKANHFSWTGLSKNADLSELINHYCLAFLNKYVNGDPSAKPEVKLPGVVELEVK